MHKRDDKELMELLSRLPKIKDNQTKEELYHKLSMHIPKKASKKRKRYAPYLVAVAVLFLSLSVPFLLNEDSEQQISMEMDRAESGEEMFMAKMESSDAQGDEEETSMEVEKSEFLNDSKVIQQILPGQELLHYAVYYESKKIVIPFGVIVSSEKIDEYHDDKVMELLRSHGLYSEEALLKAIDFTEQKASFLLYQDRYYAAVLNQEETSITDAITMLQSDYPDQQIVHSLSSLAQFLVKETDDLLTIEFIERTIHVEDVTIAMIESILLTAKSYGFSEVQFENMPVNAIGEYHFSSPIPVPIAPNPLGQSE